MEVDALDNVFTNTTQKLEKQGKKGSSAASEILWLIAGGGLLLGVVLVRYVPGLLQIRDASYQARLAAAKAAVQVHPQMAAEEKAFSDFAMRFASGPVVAPVQQTAKLRASEAEERTTISQIQSSPKATDERQSLSQHSLSQNAGRGSEDAAVGSRNQQDAPELRKPSPKHLAALRNLVLELGLASKETAKQGLLSRLAVETAALKEASESAESLTVWKVASALEALLKQLGGKAYSLTPSGLRTVTAAVDLIHTLSSPGTKPDLAENPPVRVLAVDDDPISRHAIAFTLKKTLSLPELAADGATGLELATKNAYDAIFLDIQMPGLDGFELCAKIRQTELNRKTPIVFVTCHTDFNDRAKSTAAGGQDLIAKPFLTFELGLKALTLVLQHRLKQAEPEKPADQKPTVAEPESRQLAAVL